MRSTRQRRGFTLIELLVVIAIIGVLATLLLSAIFGAKAKARVGVAKSEIRAIEAALSMYRGDQGRFPRLSPRPTANNTPIAGNDAAWNDDCHALYAALRNRPSIALGGGQGSPYLDWKPENVGYLAANYLQVTMLTNHTGGGANMTRTGVRQLEPVNYDRLSVAAFQQQYAPRPNLTGGEFLVLLDPWGNPYHYREWASIRQSAKDRTMAGTQITRSIQFVPAEVTGQVPLQQARDGIHSPDAFDIWSNGPNGINEFGDRDSDDVTSWSQ
ncbi:MAG: type II secretion system protein GspG [Planctomycetes bacterium]|nr:type II secretion system protein GspG [Planctomycetota bacterium]